MEYLFKYFISFAIIEYDESPFIPYMRFPSLSMITSSYSLPRISSFLCTFLSSFACEYNSWWSSSIVFLISSIWSFWWDHSLIIIFFDLHSSLFFVFSMKWERPFEAKGKKLMSGTHTWDCLWNRNHSR